MNRPERLVSCAAHLTLLSTGGSMAFMLNQVSTDHLDAEALLNSGFVECDWTTGIQGVSSNYPPMTNWQIAAGRGNHAGG